jgi:hypothetical protein
MIGEVIVVGNLNLRDNAALDEYKPLAERMYNIVSALPWRTHPEHVETMKRGHAEFYASGYLQICKVIREVGPFEHD